MKNITHEYRCTCGKLLSRGMILSGMIEFKCRSCKRVEYIEAWSGSAKDTEHYVLVFDAAGVLMHFSASAPTILGYRGDELLQKNVSDIVAMLSPEFYASLWQALKSKGPTTVFFQALQRHRDRSMVPVEVEAQYHMDPPGAVIFTVRKKTYPQCTDVLKEVVRG